MSVTSHWPAFDLKWKWIYHLISGDNNWRTSCRTLSTRFLNQIQELGDTKSVRFIFPSIMVFCMYINRFLWILNAVSSEKSFYPTLMFSCEMYSRSGQCSVSRQLNPNCSINSRPRMQSGLVVSSFVPFWLFCVAFESEQKSHWGAKHANGVPAREEKMFTDVRLWFVA